MERGPIPLLIGGVLVVAAILISFYYRNSFSAFIQSLGVYGIAVAILLMAFLCIIPVPSEFQIVVNMELFGVGWGLFYSWVGAVLGSIAAMYLTRWLGQGWVRRMLSDVRQKQVDEWVKRRGALGLLALRFAPFVPFHALNYVAGLVDIPLWPFVWTTALGIIPFDLWMGGVYLGISHGLIPALIAGVGALAALTLVSYMFRKRWFAAFSGGDQDENRMLHK